MKHFLLVTVLFILLMATGFAQCVPNGTSSELFHPKSEDGIPEAFAEIPYSAVVTINVPADTTVTGFPATIDSVVVTNIAGLPSGYGYSCNPPSCVFPADQRGCVEVAGLTNSQGEFPLEVNFTIHGKVSGISASYPGSYDDYVLKVGPSDSLGIHGFVDETIEGLKNFPNPFTKQTVISFHSDEASPGKFVIYNLTGSQVYQQEIAIEVGENKIEYAPRKPVPGIYFYTLKQGGKEETSRFVIAEY